MEGTAGQPEFIFKKSITEPEFVNVYEVEESIPPAYAAWRAGLIPGLLKRFTNSGAGSKTPVLLITQSHSAFSQFEASLYVGLECLNPH
jgi:hypothetical protein